MSEPHPQQQHKQHSARLQAHHAGGQHRQKKTEDKPTNASDQNMPTEGILPKSADPLRDIKSAMDSVLPEVDPRTVVREKESQLTLFALLIVFFHRCVQLSEWLVLEAIHNPRSLYHTITEKLFRALQYYVTLVEVTVSSAYDWLQTSKAWSLLTSMWLFAVGFPIYIMLKMWQQVAPFMVEWAARAAIVIELASEAVTRILDHLQKVSFVYWPAEAIELSLNTAATPFTPYKDRTPGLRLMSDLLCASIDVALPFCSRCNPLVERPKKAE